MLLREHACGQPLGGVAGQHRHHGLVQDLAVVQLGRDLVHGGAGKAATGIDGPLVRVEPGKGGQQGRVDVEQAPGVVRHKAGGQDAHEARQHHQSRRIPVQLGHQGRVKILARGKGPVVDDRGGDAEVPGDGQALGIGAVAQHGGHLGVQMLGPAAPLRRTHDGRHVGARAGNQDDDVAHEGRIIPACLCIPRICRTKDKPEPAARDKKHGRLILRENPMDLAFTPEELAFRDEVRTWVKANLPTELSHKVHNAMRLTREDMQTWAKILGKKGWLGYGWPQQFGGPGWTAVQKHLFEEECALAGAPRVVPFGPVMVAPVIMAFGNAEQQKRFLPGIASGEVWWSQGYSEPGSGSDLASLKTRAERVGDKYIVNGQKTWTTLGQYGEWIFCLVRTSTEGKPQTGISFLLIDMKSPGITVRPIKLLDGECEVNEVWFDNVEVPVENLIGEENKGWNYAKHLLAHERTNIADVNRAKRELERLKRIAKAEGVYDDLRFRDEIAKLEVDIVALEMLVLRVLSAEKSGKNSLDIAGLLKIKGSEIQQRYSELMMQAAGPFSLPFIFEAMEAGWQGDFPGGTLANAPLAANYFNMRKTTIYGGSNEVQRNIVAQTVLG